MISIPFSGSKKYCYKYVKKIVEDGDYEAVYEPFGGSCVLAVNIKNDGLVDTVVSNDYDHYFDLYPEYLDLKDKVVKQCYDHGFIKTTHGSKPPYGIKLYPDGRRVPTKRLLLPEKHIKILQEIIARDVPEKFWRYFASGNNFTFSSIVNKEHVYLKDFRYFNGYVKTDKQREYLEALNNITLEHLDYHDFIEKYRDDINNKKSLLILDPPYIGTSQKQYKGQFTEEETIELVEIAKSLNCDFVFFNKDKDQVAQWLEGEDYEFIENGKRALVSGKSRLEALAFVRGAKS